MGRNTGEVRHGDRSARVDGGRKRDAVRAAANYAVEALEQRTMLTVAAAPAAMLASPNTAPGASASLMLTWLDKSDNETSFKIERGTNGTTFTQIGTVAADATAYQDAGVTAGTRYYYRVRAANADGDSA